MLLGVSGEYEDVVEVADDEIKSLGNFVDETLEGLSGVSETETHEGKFKQTKRGDNGFGDVDFVDRDLGVQGLDQVDHGEDSGSIKTMGAIVDVFWQVFIRNSACVKIPVVAAGAPSR